MLAGLNPTGTTSLPLNSKVGIHGWEIGVSDRQLPSSNVVPDLSRITVPSTRLPTLVDSIQTCPGTECLETSGGSVGLLELIQDFRQVGLIVSNTECKG
jgi:hypothetical protein